jgi:hypothetical protein
LLLSSSSAGSPSLPQLTSFAQSAARELGPQPNPRPRLAATKRFLSENNMSQNTIDHPANHNHNAPPSFLGRVLDNDALKKGVAAAAAGALIAVVTEARWPSRS